MTKRKKVAVIGCAGKMGQFVCRYLLASNDYELVAGVDVARAGDDLGTVLGLGNIGISVSNNLNSALTESNAEIAIDFTIPASVVPNTAVCLQAKVPVIIGTTGINHEDCIKIDNLAKKMDVGVMIVPNFSVGAILMMEFAQKAARYMKSAEIIELHHDQKLDRPSGTSNMTRNLMLDAMKESDKNVTDEAIPIHSVRLPGLVAHQMVILGDIGQTLTIRHDSLSRDSFMPGIGLALSQIEEIRGLKIGLSLD